MIPSQLIFKDYDIRGVYPTQLNEESAFVIGKALGSFLINAKINNMVVGRDDRKSSPSLSEEFIKGLLESGVAVTDIGITLTPVIHYLTCFGGFDFGVNVTASHNPKEYNGFRMDYVGAEPFYGKDIQKLYKISCEGNYISGKGNYTKDENQFDLYLNYLKSIFKFPKNRVVVDCGNGAISNFSQTIFKELGCDVIEVNCTIDSNFVHGIPNPENKAFMKELAQKVVSNKAQVGVAFDTDSDRFGVVDENGNIYENDKLLLLFAQAVLSAHKGSKIYFDVKSSETCFEEITKAGGIPTMLRTGHPYFVEALNKEGVLGCEYSGHAYFKHKAFAYDDGVYAACMVLEIMNSFNQPLSSLMDKFPKRWHTGEIKIAVSEQIKFEIFAKIQASIKNNKEIKRIIEIDGIRAYLSEDAWLLLRPSNTSPSLTARFEGISETEILQEKKFLADILDSFGLNMPTDIEMYKC